MIKQSKITIIINNLGIGGAERLVVDDIKEMLRIGVDVTLVTLKYEPILSFDNELNLRPDRKYQIVFKGFLDISSWIKLVKVIKASQPNLVITQLWYANTIGRIACVLSGVRRIISFEQNVYDTVKNRKMFIVDYFLQFFSTKVIAVSEAVKESLIRHLIEEKRIDVLYNSVDLSKFAINYSDVKLREEYNIPKQAFLYLFIGRLIYQKAVDILIEAFDQIGKDAYLLIVGQGVDFKQLEKKAKDSRSGERIIFAGVRDGVPSLFALADCFVLPSRHEGLPLVLIEALAAGKAIIVSDFEASREVIIDKKNGLVFPRENAHALAEAMVQIKDNITLRSSLARESKKTSERFSISSHVQNLLRYANI